jgi:hypothetical protein
MPYRKEAAPQPAQRYQKDLEHLYARRVAIDTLIQSLHDYEQLRMKRLRGMRKTA